MATVCFSNSVGRHCLQAKGMEVICIFHHQFGSHHLSLKQCDITVRHLSLVISYYCQINSFCRKRSSVLLSQVYDISFSLSVWGNIVWLSRNSGESAFFRTSTFWLRTLREREIRNIEHGLMFLKVWIPHPSNYGLVHEVSNWQRQMKNWKSFSLWF